MSKKSHVKPLSIALGTAFAASMAASNIATAAEGNPFATNELSSGYMQVAEGKCGGQKKPATEGKCGAQQKAKKEGQCGENNKAKKEGKCGEGKCGGNKEMKKDMEGDKEMKKDMEGKCGGNK